MVNDTTTVHNHEEAKTPSVKKGDYTHSLEYFYFHSPRAFYFLNILNLELT